jgi:hypothetical protein
MTDYNYKIIKRVDKDSGQVAVSKIGVSESKAPK